MPDKLDRCIREVKADLLSKNPNIDEKEAESRAWAICTEALNQTQEEK